MTETPTVSIPEHFASLDDPRRDHGKLYPIEEILLLTICAVICGADTFVAIEQFGRAKADFLRRFLPFKEGIPSHDTLGDLFARIDPARFEHCFAGWVRAAFERTGGQVIALDGKRLRRSYDRDAKRAPIEVVSAWATQNHLVLGQVRVEEDSNEITAIEPLLALLDLSGCIVSIDAAGCQREVAAAIIEREADYVLALKGNQRHLHEEALALFARLEAHGFAGCEATETADGGHDRVEVRRCWALDVEERGLVDTAGWPSLRTVALVECERTLLRGGLEKTTRERRLYISSLQADAVRLLSSVRSHWQIENQVHWVLDVAFGEDQSRVRKGHAASNMALLRRLALNLLKQERSLKLGLASKRLRAGWDEAYLLKILQQL